VDALAVVTLCKVSNSKININRIIQSLESVNTKVMNLRFVFKFECCAVKIDAPVITQKAVEVKKKEAI